MAQGIVRFEKKDKTCTLTMNRPKFMNSINHDLIQGLEETFARIASDEEIRVVVLQGAGGNFCSGADMSWLNTQSGAPEMFDATKRFGKVIQTMRELPIPVITKVRGYAVGGGANLALAGDFVMASHSARFIQPFVNLGAVLDGGGTYFLPRLVGPVKARELALLGEAVDGETAASMGLIYGSVADEDLDGEVAGLAASLSRKPPKAVALIKEGLEKSFEMSLPETLEWEASHQAVMLQTGEHKEAVREFLRSRGKTG
jgi:enoyl-CoA hydratase/carnithine racemase